MTATTVGGIAPYHRVLPTSDSPLPSLPTTARAAFSRLCPGGKRTRGSYLRQLSGAAIAPVAGVISADNTTVYVGTSGDDLVHLVNRGTLSDSSTLAPNLTNSTGTPVPVNLLAQKPRRTT